MENEKVTYFEKMKITSKGLQLLHKLIVSGEPLQITRAVIGDGIPEQDPVTLTELVHEIPSRQTGESGTSAIVDLQMYLPEDEQTILTRVRVQNGDTPFMWRELAFIADDPDEGEIKFSYTVDRSEHAMLFPAYDGVPISGTVDVAFYVSNSANVDINVTLPPEVDPEEFMAHKNAEELDHPDGCVNTRHIADGAIKSAQIGIGAITEKKLSQQLQTKINNTESSDLAAVIKALITTDSSKGGILGNEFIITENTSYPGDDLSADIDIGKNQVFTLTNESNLEWSVLPVNDEVGYTLSKKIPSGGKSVCIITTDYVTGVDHSNGAIKVLLPLNY